MMLRESTARVLGYNLRYYRHHLAMTQSQVALKSRLSLRQYQILESGNSNATMETLCLLANTFEVTIDALLRLGHVRITQQSDKFLELYRATFEDEEFGADIRDPSGAILWGNAQASVIQTGTTDGYRSDNRNELTGSALEVFKHQISSEKRGMMNPYLNYTERRSNGEVIHIRFYPALVFPNKGMNPYFASVYVTRVETDNQSSYFKYCKKLLTISG